MLNTSKWDLRTAASPNTTRTETRSAYLINVAGCHRNRRGLWDCVRNVRPLDALSSRSITSGDVFFPLNKARILWSARRFATSLTLTDDGFCKTLETRNNFQYAALYADVRIVNLTIWSTVCCLYYI